MSGRPLLLDGGTGRELLRMGAPFRQPEWSALALIEAPDFVSAVHRRYLEAGADLITTNTYALVPFHLGAERFARDGTALLALAGRLAREAADGAGGVARVAGSLPPVCGSYRPDLFDAAVARPVLERMVEVLEPYVDLWLSETVSSEAEMELMSRVVPVTRQPWWVSYTLAEQRDASAAGRLRSGESVASAATHAARLGASAVLFNCCQPEVVGDAIVAARRALDSVASGDGGRHVMTGAYANAFPPQPHTASANADLNELRTDLGPAAYLGWVEQWLQQGADIVGGCCGVGPEHITAIHAFLAAR